MTEIVDIGRKTGLFHMPMMKIRRRFDQGRLITTGRRTTQTA
jgi:hypothetical protein